MFIPLDYRFNRRGRKHAFHFFKLLAYKLITGLDFTLDLRELKDSVFQVWTR